jgi:2-aminomuconate deaminase
MQPKATRESLYTTRAPDPVGAYPYTRRVGNLLFLAGIGPRKRGSKDIPGVTLNADGTIKTCDIEAQIRSCFENVRIVLEEAGSSWDNIVDVLVFLTDMPRDFAVYNRLWAEYFPPGPNQPTRTTIQVTALPQAGNAPIAFEVKVIACAEPRPSGSG